jgi:hypothetical protein
MKLMKVAHVQRVARTGRGWNLHSGEGGIRTRVLDPSQTTV